MESALSHELDKYIFYLIYGVLGVKILGFDKLAKLIVNGAGLFFGVLFLFLIGFGMFFSTTYFLIGLLVDDELINLGVTFVVMLFVAVWFIRDEYKSSFSRQALNENFFEFLAGVFKNLYWSGKYYIEEKLSTNAGNYSGSYEEIFNKLDKKYWQEKNKLQLNMVFTGIFIFLTYELLLSSSSFWMFVNYGISWWAKYLGLACIFVILLYGYFLYSKVFIKRAYEEIFKLINFLAHEKKYVLLVTPNGARRGYSYTVEDKNPWSGGDAKHYFFVENKDGLCAYWLKPSVDFEHFKNVAEGISLRGVRGFLDYVLKINERVASK